MIVNTPHAHHNFVRPCFHKQPNFKHNLGTWFIVCHLHSKKKKRSLILFQVRSQYHFLQRRTLVFLRKKTIATTVICVNRRDPNTIKRRTPPNCPTQFAFSWSSSGLRQNWRPLLSPWTPSGMTVSHVIFYDYVTHLNNVISCPTYDSLATRHFYSQQLRSPTLLLRLSRSFSLRLHFFVLRSKPAAATLNNPCLLNN